jgi:hypothetical protein
MNIPELIPVSPFFPYTLLERGIIRFCMSPGREQVKEVLYRQIILIMMACSSGYCDYHSFMNVPEG